MKTFTRTWNLLKKWLRGLRTEKNRKPTPVRDSRRDTNSIINPSHLFKTKKSEKERYDNFLEQFPMGLFHSDPSYRDLDSRIVRASPQVDFGIEAEREAIKQFCRERGIVELVHFTHAENLPTIAKFGLVSREELEKRGIRYYFNDQSRLEGMRNAICLSISFPNYRMFYKYRGQSKIFVVLSISVELLWNLQCLFCPTNAASNLCRLLLSSPETLTGLPALKRMFAENILPLQIRRADLGIPDYYTTDPQAEVLCLEPIPPTYIKKIYHNGCPDIENKVPLAWRSLIVRRDEYFAPRKDYQFWSRGIIGV